ncbi:MAG: hypothetical protein LBC79_04165 [Deltaproteobacteria bacterium]|jgi:hypothetical protein|nr:hypothetical protein [Deltaproteobacteria bacterium]
MRIFMLTVLALGLLLCAGCGKQTVSLPGETPVYTVSCDRTPDDCHVGAQTLCNGPYEAISAAPDKKAAPGSFGWVAASGEQQDSGSGGGRYTLRIRCK